MFALHFVCHAGRERQVEQAWTVAAKWGSLINGGKEARGPVADAIDLIVRGVAEDDIGRQVLVDRAERVGDPRADRRASDAGLSGLEVAESAFVVIDQRVHRTNLAEIIGASGQVRQEFTELHS